MRMRRFFGVVLTIVDEELKYINFLDGRDPQPRFALLDSKITRSDASGILLSSIKQNTPVDLLIQVTEDENEGFIYTLVRADYARALADR